MASYENSFLDLRIEFPPTWNLVSWKNSRINRNRRRLYQMKDNDLPSKSARSCQTSKFLFTAELPAAESPAMVDADIEISVFRLTPDEDLGESMRENFRRDNAYRERNGIVGIERSEGHWKINGVDFRYHNVELNGGDRESHYRFFFCRIDDVHWLYGKIAAHKEGAFEEALSIVAEMNWRGAGNGGKPNSASS